MSSASEWLGPLEGDAIQDHGGALPQPLAGQLDRRLGGEIEVERRVPYREIGFGFGFVPCVRARRSCVRAGEAKLRGRARKMIPTWLGRFKHRRLSSLSRGVTETMKCHENLVEK